MFKILKDIFGFGPKPDYKRLVSHGAQVIDVRSKEEFQQGHLKGALNIPLPILLRNLALIRKDRPVITCCASGIRSASAKNILKSNGFQEVYNGGGWKSLDAKLK